jgi:hypothetical protein
VFHKIISDLPSTWKIYLNWARLLHRGQDYFQHGNNTTSQTKWQQTGHTYCRMDRDNIVPGIITTDLTGLQQTGWDYNIYNRPEMIITDHRCLQTKG